MDKRLNCFQSSMEPLKDMDSYEKKKKSLIHERSYSNCSWRQSTASFLSSFLFLFPAVLLAAVKDLEEDKKEAEEILLTAVKNKIPTAFELDKEAAIFKCSSYNVSF